MLFLWNLLEWNKHLVWFIMEDAEHLGAGMMNTNRNASLIMGDTSEYTGSFCFHLGAAKAEVWVFPPSILSPISTSGSQLIIERQGWLFCPAATSLLGGGVLELWKILERPVTDSFHISCLSTWLTSFSHSSGDTPSAFSHLPGYDRLPPHSTVFFAFTLPLELE